ncbi:MAG: Acg family FMN-binding oxidoreductase [Actinomycetes bacterium]
MAAERLSRPAWQLMLAAATAAPSLHNSQPWRFTVSGAQIDLYADPGRQLREVDPTGRQLLISCGAALFNLRLAAGHLGLEPKVRVLPDPAQPTLVARATISGHRMAPGLSELLYQAIPYRHTNRHPFEDVRVPEETVLAMKEAGQVEGAGLHVPREREERRRLAELIRVADFEHDHRPAVAVEAVQWTGVDADRRDGVPGYALGPVADDPDATVRDLRRGAPLPDRPREHFEAVPVLAVLFTAADDPGSWVRAGQALQRVLLTATLHGISASFVNQPLEVPALRRTVLGPGNLQGHPQMLLRLGRGTPVPPTPRRPLDEVTRQRF